MSNTDDQYQSLTILPECAEHAARAPAKRPYVSPQLLMIGTAGDMVQGGAGPYLDFFELGHFAT